MGLRLKILSGFLVLSSMLALAGVWAIYQMGALGASAQKILDDNYKSIQATQGMIEALERQDSAILLLLLGNWEEGRSIVSAADQSFRKNLSVAQKNLTIPGEEELVQAVAAGYDAFTDTWERPIVGTNRQHNLDWYTEEVRPAFQAVESSVSKLMSINDAAMYTSAVGLKNRANRAATPGVVAALSALVISVLFNYLVNVFMVTPIISITNGVVAFSKSGRAFSPQIQTRDEIHRLASAVQDLCAQVARTRA